MAKTEYQFTVRNLAAIGILEDIYDIYCSLQTEFHTLELNKIPYGNIKNQIIKTLKKQLNAFLKDNTHIFTDDYEIIYVNAFSINGVYLYDIKPEGSFYQYSFISFSEFLRVCQRIIFKILFKRKTYTNKSVKPEKIWDELNARIFDTAYNNFKKIEISDKSSISLEEVIVYKNLSSISCNTNHHKIIPNKIEVPLIKTDKHVLLPIHICEDCKKKFVGNETLKAFERFFGPMIIEKRPELDGSNPRLIYGDESRLHSLGYNVIEGELTEKERRNLLKYLIDNGIMTDFEIRKDIENAIRIFNWNPKYDNAVWKWQSDLVFLSELCK